MGRGRKGEEDKNPGGNALRDISISYPGRDGGKAKRETNYSDEVLAFRFDLSPELQRAGNPGVLFNAARISCMCRTKCRALAGAYNSLNFHCM